MYKFISDRFSYYSTIFVDLMAQGKNRRSQSSIGKRLRSTKIIQRLRLRLYKSAFYWFIEQFLVFSEFNKSIIVCNTYCNIEKVLSS
jgi:hypothetical protein